MIEKTYTNTALATARRCLREYDLRYNHQLEPVNKDNEALDVGSCWHKAFDVLHKGGDPYAAIDKHAPSSLWAEKLRRLFAAHQWRWKDQPVKIVEAERTFRIQETEDHPVYEGQIDGIAQDDIGRRIVVERKTTSDDLAAESSYWDRLRLDVQVGLYALAITPLPSAILYDVVRKPTIRPKGIAKKEAARLLADLDKNDAVGAETGVPGCALYFGENFLREEVEFAIDANKETDRMYGARLTADIGDQPEKYFARREIPRTAGDYERLKKSLDAQVEVLEFAGKSGLLHPNPDQCHAFNRRCDFLSMCPVGRTVEDGDPAPDGFQRREHRHPELVPDSETETPEA